jgi:tight adherence protein C
MTTIMLITGLAACAIAITLVVRGLSGNRLRTSQTVGQIKEYGYAGTAAAPTGDGPRRPLTALAGDLASWLGEMVGDRGNQSKMKAELMAAAMYTTSVGKLLGYRVLAAFGFGGLWVWAGTSSGMPPWLILVGTIIAVVMGWVGPMAVVRRRADDRLHRIERGMPDLMDLLVVTVEAGMSFNASLKIATERLDGPLGDELRLTLQEQSLGLSTEQALRNMLMRCDTTGVRSFVRSVLQGETLGVSIGQIMRNLAEEVRLQQKASAEERAQKAPVKMLFPLIFLIFPAIFIVLLAPAVIEFSKAFNNVAH